MLRCVNVPVKHNAPNVAKAVLVAERQFGLDGKAHLFVRDSAKNMVKSMDLIQFASVGCMDW
jgi:hypothetical protein